MTRKRSANNPERSRARARTSSNPDGAGRPTRCTPETVARLVKLVEIGVPITVACRTEGLGRATWHRWRVAAAAGEEPYVELVGKLETAISKGVATITMQLVKASQKDWKAAAWWLERRVPALYAAKQSVRVQNVNVDLTDEELDEAMARHGYVRAGLPREPDDE